ncbi:unnamed protein product [Spirodela intermedia]|uniref:Uncharacterized protein n=2 Tax=Spirodela intermedia TaxID=51605 RepID=A0A7I8KNK8_SPIIN|nr:unnamed protein product [Spirodela intermedia]CAA6662664.1 unnamed protein product [Spirodela intermedia]CAA7399072.1 unnamed protein product [Spirodela intermedia]
MNWRGVFFVLLLVVGEAPVWARWERWRRLEGTGQRGETLPAARLDAGGGGGGNMVYGASARRVPQGANPLHN